MNDIVLQASLRFKLTQTAVQQCVSSTPGTPRNAGWNFCRGTAPGASLSGRSVGPVAAEQVVEGSAASEVAAVAESVASAQCLN